MAPVYKTISRRALKLLDEGLPCKKGGRKMDELVPLVANLGFPIVVSLYLLIRVEKRLEELITIIKEANENIAKML